MEFMERRIVRSAKNEIPVLESIGLESIWEDPPRESASCQESTAIEQILCQKNYDSAKCKTKWYGRI
jgi:hypothetical protein